MAKMWDGCHVARGFCPFAKNAHTSTDLTSVRARKTKSYGGAWDDATQVEARSRRLRSLTACFAALDSCGSHARRRSPQQRPQPASSPPREPLIPIFRPAPTARPVLPDGCVHKPNPSDKPLPTFTRRRSRSTTRSRAATNACGSSFEEPSTTSPSLYRTIRWPRQDFNSGRRFGRALLGALPTARAGGRGRRGTGAGIT